MSYEKPRQSKVADLVNAINAKSDSNSLTPSISIKRTSSAGSTSFSNEGSHREAASSLEEKPSHLKAGGVPMRNGIASHSLGRNPALRVSNVSSITFSSDESSDEEEGITIACPDVGKQQMTRSLGRTAKMAVISRDFGSAKVAPGGLGDVDRLGKTAYAQCNGVDSKKSKSVENSPDHAFSRRGKIESNPFFQQDRLSKVRLSTSEGTERRSSAPDSQHGKLPYSKSESAVTTRNTGILKTSADPCKGDRDNSALISRSFPSSASSTPDSSPGRRKKAYVIEPMSVQRRIKMWAEKEKEAKQIKEEQEKLERRKSTPLTYSHRSPSHHRAEVNGSSETTAAKLSSSSVGNILESSTKGEGDDEAFDDVIAILSPKTVEKVENIYETIPALLNASGIEELHYIDTQGLYSKQPEDKLSVSLNGGSPSKSSKKGSSDPAKMSLSKWALANIFRSPRLGRRKKADSSGDKEDSLSQSDSKNKKISNRNSKKRKAQRKKQNLKVEESSSSQADHRNESEGEDSSPSHQPAKPRSYSVIPYSSPVVLRKLRTTSDPPKPPDIVPQETSTGSTAVSQKTGVDEKTGHDDECSKPIKISVTPSEAVEGEEEEEEENEVYGDVATQLPTIRMDRTRTASGVKDRTLSREIREFISDGFDSIGDQRKYSITPPLEHSESLLKSPFLSLPHDMKPSYSDPSLSVTVSAVHIGFSPVEPSDSSSDDQSTPTTVFAEEACPIQSSLDSGMCARAHLKERRKMSESFSEPMKTIMSSSNKEKYLRKGSISPSEESSEGVIATSLMYADAVWDRVALDADELSFRVGDVVEILDMTDDVWWHGSVSESSGWFPASFVRLRIGQEDEDSEQDTTKVQVDKEKTTKTSNEEEGGENDSLKPLPARNPDRRISVKRRMTIRRKDSAPSLPRKLTHPEVRAKIVEEILNTERDYVGNLQHIIEGFLERCKDYNTLFDGEKVNMIFSNVEQVYRFQKDFLCELEAKVDHDHMEHSEIGEVFVLNRHEFAVYSEYCNNHPHAVNEMNILQQNEQYTFFFESCRLLRNLQDISLEGFLLTPVQKICKYPLQLTELLKYTSEEHPDHAHLMAAQKAMKEVAMLINEQKRRMENIGKIGRWQETIENWKGEDILESSTELIHSGELHKISKGHSQERHFFLFDGQLVYCKKDISGKLSFKGRLDTEKCPIVSLEDGEVLHNGNAVRNAWRMKNDAKEKSYIIFAKTAEIKEVWMKAFERERKRVEEDREKGFHVSIKMKRAAVTLCASTQASHRRRRSFHKKHALTESVDGGKLSLSQSNKKLKGKTRKNSTSASTSLVIKKL